MRSSSNTPWRDSGWRESFDAQKLGKREGRQRGCENRWRGQGASRRAGESRCASDLGDFSSGTVRKGLKGVSLPFHRRED